MEGGNLTMKPELVDLEEIFKEKFIYILKEKRITSNI